MNKKIFLIAGEKSGDDLGSRLMQNLLSLNPSLRFYGVGGPLMTSYGLNSLFSYETLSVMGFVEVLPKIFEIKGKIKQTVDEILHLKPALIITIDLPGFNFRVAKALREKGYRGKIFHYVAPTVWAYKENRAAKFAQVFDRMICILPFEEQYFIKHGMQTNYIGNPVIEQSTSTKILPRPKVKKILICCGSRIAEIKKLLPIFCHSLNLLCTGYNFEAIILTHFSHHTLISDILKKANFKYSIISPQDADKILTMAKCDLALTKSGTVTTEIALAGVPMVVAHKINWLSYLIIKSMVKISSICLVNLIAKKQIVPELIQKECEAEKIANALKSLITNYEKRALQVKEAQQIFSILGNKEKKTPSEKLAKIILAELNL